MEVEKLSDVRKSRYQISLKELAYRCGIGNLWEHMTSSTPWSIQAKEKTKERSKDTKRSHRLYDLVSVKVQRLCEWKFKG